MSSEKFFIASATLFSRKTYSSVLPAYCHVLSKGVCSKIMSSSSMFNNARTLDEINMEVDGGGGGENDNNANDDKDTPKLGASRAQPAVGPFSAQPPLGPSSISIGSASASGSRGVVEVTGAAGSGTLLPPQPGGLLTEEEQLEQRAKEEREILSRNYPVSSKT